jgi:hypothetical protein
MYLVLLAILFTMKTLCRKGNSDISTSLPGRCYPFVSNWNDWCNFTTRHANPEHESGMQSQSGSCRTVKSSILRCASHKATNSIRLTTLIIHIRSLNSETPSTESAHSMLRAVRLQMLHVGEAGSIQGLQAEGFDCTCSKPFQEFLVPIVLPNVVQWLRGEAVARRGSAAHCAGPRVYYDR